MHPGDLNPHQGPESKLLKLIERASELGIRMERAPEFDHETALYVRRLPDEIPL
jgi:hypothetical protein